MTKNEERHTTRRGFLGWLAAGLAALGVSWSPGSGPRDPDLREADFYSPHDLAG